MTVESNYVNAIAMLSDWLKNVALVFQPIAPCTRDLRMRTCWANELVNYLVSSYRILCIFIYLLVYLFPIYSCKLLVHEYVKARKTLKQQFSSEFGSQKRNTSL